jgi:pantothenate kinase-related protein Tda10
MQQEQSPQQRSRLPCVVGFQSPNFPLDSSSVCLLQAQQDVAQRHAGNRLLQYRGNAGSHDLELGAATLGALKAAVTDAAEVALPR